MEEPTELDFIKTNVDSYTLYMNNLREYLTAKLQNVLTSENLDEVWGIFIELGGIHLTSIPEVGKFFKLPGGFDLYKFLTYSLAYNHTEYVSVQDLIILHMKEEEGFLEDVDGFKIYCLRNSIESFTVNN